MKIWSLVVVLLMASMPAHAGVEADARAHSAAFARAMNARDAKAMLALYSDDAHVIWPGQGEEAVGRSRIKKLIKNTLKTFPPEGRVVLKSQDVINLGNGYMATVGHWEESFRGQDGKRQTIPLRTTEIIHKKGNRMVYVLDHASVGLPPAPER